MGEHWCKEPCTYGKRCLCTGADVLEQRTLHWEKRKERKRKKKERGSGRRRSSKSNRNMEELPRSAFFLSCWTLFVQWIESVSPIVAPVCGGEGGGWGEAGSFVKSGMKWTFDVRFAAGFERDTRPAFSCLGPSVVPREAPRTDNASMWADVLDAES